jgi:hypothetical protein
LGRSGILLRIFAELQVDLLAKVRSLIDADTVQYVANAHPQFLPFITHVQTGFFFGASSDWGEVPSLHRKFVAETLQYISRRAGFAKALAELVDNNWTAKDIHTVVSKLPLPWLLPHDRYLDDMDREMRSHRLHNKVCDREMYRLSAATIAITYLNSLSLKMRKKVRKIVIHEDRMSVAWPECHGQGLIKFCQENPNLRVERRVSLWRNIWPASCSSSVASVAKIDLSRESWDGKRNMLKSTNITRPKLAPWIMEALALPSLGMPAGSFTLTLDGSPTPRKTTEVFAITQQDASWQEAFERIHAFDSIPCYEIRHNRSYIMNRFPHAIRDIVDGKSLVKCNFEVEPNFTPDGARNQEIDQWPHVQRDWSMDQWDSKWDAHYPKAFGTQVPLPTWLRLRQEDALWVGRGSYLGGGAFSNTYPWRGGERGCGL